MLSEYECARACVHITYIHTYRLFKNDISQTCNVIYELLP